MARDTSIETYHQIEAEGLLSAMRFRVYSTVFHMGPCTSGEAFSYLQRHGFRDGPLTQSRARFTELRDLGVLQELGERPCSITGRTAILWDVTSKLPAGVLRKRPGKSTIRECLQQLREMAAGGYRFSEESIRVFRWLKHISSA